MSTLPSLSRAARSARRALVALCILGGTSFASAQTVTLRGDVENVGATFVLKCTPVTLVSGGANLAAVLGQDVQAVGTVIAPNTVSVTSVAVVTDVFAVNANAHVGGSLKFEITGPAGRVEQVYVSLGEGFAIAKKMAWFLDGASQHLLLQGVIPAAGKLQMQVAIPNLPVLANLDLSFQDVRLPAGGGFVLGNADCVTIQP